jgi:hypothetical protein
MRDIALGRIYASSLIADLIYAAKMVGAGPNTPQYDWDVDETIQARAMEFVATFNALFDDSLPLPIAQNARRFWNAWKDIKVFGRCVNLGKSPTGNPPKQYRWAINRHSTDELFVEDFWDDEMWTTERYRQKVDPQDDTHEVRKVVIPKNLGFKRSNSLF